jgi:hypothetical protein
VVSWRTDCGFDPRAPFAAVAAIAMLTIHNAGNGIRLGGLELALSCHYRIAEPLCRVKSHVPDHFFLVFVFRRLVSSCFVLLLRLLLLFVVVFFFFFFFFSSRTSKIQNLYMRRIARDCTLFLLAPVKFASLPSSAPPPPPPPPLNVAFLWCDIRNPYTCTHTPVICFMFFGNRRYCLTAF